MKTKKPRKSFKQFKTWLKVQIKNHTLFKNLFITGNAWGTFYLSSHCRQSDGQVMQGYHSLATAEKSAKEMSAKTNKRFAAYKCLYCDDYHIGKTKKQ